MGADLLNNEGVFLSEQVKNIEAPTLAVEG